MEKKKSRTVNVNMHQFVSPLGFAAIYEEHPGRKRKNVYQKVTKKNLMRSCMVKYPHDKKRVIEDVRAESKRWGVEGWTDNQLNVYYHDVKNEFDANQIKPVSEVAKAS